nr:amine sulfotransferase-like [Rhipicephalus microplus]
MALSRPQPYAKIIDGVPRCPFATPESVRHGLRFMAQKGDVLEVSYPRSGTHWVQCIIQLILNRGEPFSEYMEFRLRAPIIEYRPDLPPRPTSKPLRTLCTHLPLCLEKLNPEAKYVYVARNPWDVCVSLYHHVTSLSFYRFQDGTFDDFLEAFFTGRLPYGCYFEHLVAGYSLKDEPNILFLTYEELQRDLRGGVLRLASFMGENHLKDLKENPVEGQNLLDVIVKNTSTDSMKKVMIFDLTKNFYPEVDELLKNLKPSTKAAHAGDAKRHELVRNGKVGQWKEYFSAEQLQRMEAAIKEKTSGSSVMSLWSDIRADALRMC